MAVTLRKLVECQPQLDELIVVEQSSELNSQAEEALKLFGSRGTLMRQSRPNAQVARNEAARKSRAEILLFLDDDVDPERNLIEAHLENYRDPSIHAVGGFYLEPGETEEEKPRKRVWWRPLTKMEMYPACYKQRVDSPLWPSCNGSIRREVFLALRGFDENYKYTFLDDTDLAVRMQKAGYRCVHDPKARLFHRKEPTGGNRPVKPGDRVIASREKWYTWIYFFWMNYGFQGLGEIVFRMKSNVFRRPYLLRPGLFLRAVFNFIYGFLFGLKKIMEGRRMARLG
ncbi:glycosyltransferase [bacterium]|nr:glycosyltransferase [bacterium]